MFYNNKLNSINHDESNVLFKNTTEKTFSNRGKGETQILDGNNKENNKLDYWLIYIV